MVRLRRLLAMGFVTAGLLGLTGVVGACRSTPAPSVQSEVSPSFAAATVGDIAVAAPTSGGDLADPLRAALYQGLIAHRYSVLDPDFVDGGGRGGAMLLTTVSRGSVVTGVRTTLYDMNGAMLFKSSVVLPSSEADADTLAESLLRDLPSR